MPLSLVGNRASPFHDDRTGMNSEGTGMATRLRSQWFVVATRGRPRCENSVEGFLLMEESQSLVWEGAGREGASC